MADDWNEAGFGGVNTHSLTHSCTLSYTRTRTPATPSTFPHPHSRETHQHPNCPLPLHSSKPVFPEHPPPFSLSQELGLSLEQFGAAYDEKELFARITSHLINRQQVMPAGHTHTHTRNDREGLSIQCERVCVHALCVDP